MVVARNSWSCGKGPAASMPSKVSAERLLPHHRRTQQGSQMRPVLWTSFLLLLLMLQGTLSASISDNEEDHILDEEGVCPVKCGCLDSFVQCTKLNLSRAPSRIPKWADSLDLSNNKLTESVNESVANLPMLKVLRLKRNRLREIPIFTGLDNVEKLTVSHNQIVRVSSEAIAALPRLEHLDLSRNMIKFLFADSFPAGNSLKVVNLEANRIEDMHQNALNNLVQVVDLKMKGNSLTAVTADHFLGLRQLKRLDLNGNRMEAINGLTFRNLSELRILQLRNNRLRELQPGAFHGLNVIEKLELDNNRLTSVAKDWMFNLTSLHTLSLTNNTISVIESDSWDFVNGLHTLELSNNRLESIDRTTLEKLTNLRELYLRNNRIKTISESAFQSVPNLEVLDLSQNQISSAVEDSNAPFSSLQHLLRFDLSGNRIMSINQRAFLGLTTLDVLDLTDNNVTTIQNNAFGDLVSLKQLLIDSPTLLCDCQLQWFHGWLWGLRDTEQEVILDKLKPVCFYPVWLRGRVLMELGMKNLTCNDSPKPKIIEEPPKTLLALKGKNLNLTCTATTTSRQELRFQWRRDNVEVNPALYKKTVLHEPTEFDNSTVVSSVLELHNVNQNHVGNYQCIVANDYGSTYSMKHKITVGTLPTFKKRPSNKTLNSGGTIRLDCAVSGEPRASLAWLKDGGNDFPAARERRMHVMTEDDVFFITEAKVHDAGVYSCTAENVVGAVHANATIVVLEAPTLVKQLEDKEVLPGTPTVLECKASGAPRPSVKWTKDGQPIGGISERYYLAAEDQLLVIMDAQARDAGVYECEIWNDLGSDVGRMKLTVGTQPKKVVQAQFDSLSIIIIIAVGCILGTSIIWLVIIYHTKKAAAPNGNSSFGGGRNSQQAINNSGLATMLTVADGQMCATSLLPNNSPRVNLISGMGHGRDADRSMYMQQQQSPQHPHVGFLRTMSPVRLNMFDEQLLLRGGRPGREDDEDETRSCKDSGNGDSAKERNPTSDSDDEVDEMIEMQEQQGRMGSRGKSLNESMERSRFMMGAGDGGPMGSPLRGMSGSTFKGSSASGVLGETMCSSSSDTLEKKNNNNVAYGAPTVT